MNDSSYGAGEFPLMTQQRMRDLTMPTSIKVIDVANSISTLRPGIVHRLDKGIGGVIVVAKVSSALATLSEAFAERSAKKTIPCCNDW